MPEDPQWASYNTSLERYSNYIYGTEYQVPSNSFLPNFKTRLNDDVPCAVCRSLNRASAVMFPARTSCYSGFNLEYTGYLMAGYSGHQSGTTYTCVDSEPEAISGGRADYNGRLLYSVESRCGSLNCPPYVEGREVTCAVCTR